MISTNDGSRGGIDLDDLYVQGSHKPGKPGVVREFCKPEKVRESQGICDMVREFFMRCRIFHELLIYELIFACNV